MSGKHRGLLGEGARRSRDMGAGELVGLGESQWFGLTGVQLKSRGEGDEAGQVEPSGMDQRPAAGVN